MGALIASPNQALLASETRNAQERRKEKGKVKRNIEFEPKYDFDPAYEASGSMMEKILEQHNVSLPKGARLILEKILNIVVRDSMH